MLAVVKVNALMDGGRRPPPSCSLFYTAFTLIILHSLRHRRWAPEPQHTPVLPWPPNLTSRQTLHFGLASTRVAISLDS